MMETHSYKLVGSIMNGQLWGNVDPDSVLLGLAEFEDQLNVSLYPSIANSYIRIEGDELNGALLNIVDLNGRSIRPPERIEGHTPLMSRTWPRAFMGPRWSLKDGALLYVS